MPPKNLTPYQFSKNLTYVQDTPKFLQMLTGTDTLHPKESQLQDKLQPTEFEGDEYEETEEEKPQIVVLKSGKHLSAEEVEQLKQENEASSSSEDGKIKFRKPSKTSKQKIEEIGVTSSKRKQPLKEKASSDTTSVSREKKKKKKPNKNLLSFTEEE